MTDKSAGSAAVDQVRKSIELSSAHFLSLVELGILKTFIDHKVFVCIYCKIKVTQPTDVVLFQDNIPDDGDISVHELATKVGGETGLVQRFASYLVSSGILESPSPGCLAHTTRSQAYRTGQVAAMFVVHVYTFLLRPVASWSAYFDANGLAEPKTPDSIPLGWATGHPHLSLYGILDAEPALADLFNGAQAGSAGIYPLKGTYDLGWLQSALADADAERPAIVDIGGGTGLAMRDILVDHPFIPPAQCAVFDFPKTVAKAKREGTLAEVNMVGGSMLERLPQQIRGARVYQFRRVLSDFPDAAIELALRNVRDACEPDTRVLIVEELLTPQRSRFFLAQDISVLNFGGKRRSETMFGVLADRAGFRINGVVQNASGEFGVVELISVPVRTFI